MRTFNIREVKKGAAITVKVLPRAKRTELVGVMDDGTVRIRVAAAPEDGAANEELVEFLSETLAVPKDQIEIVGGQFSERKLISILGITPAEVEAAIHRLTHAHDSEATTPEDEPDKKDARRKTK